ncbi:MAG: glycosyltransferase family 2 protein, partial [Sulfitobacter sp.]|nr:glycosyltransferase family 2 protein [Sulfitobacter sp.]
MSKGYEITALVLTHNEQANIARTLDSIAWVDRILVVDSGSSDRTLEIIAAYPQAEVVHRPFTTFAEQCNFGLSKIDTEWVLSMDADYVFPVSAAEGIRQAIEHRGAAGYSVDFDYAIYGSVVKGSILPPRSVIYKKHLASYVDDGHGHRVEVTGIVERLPFKIVHDDRKPLSRWASAQIGYARTEADKLSGAAPGGLSTPDRIRQLIMVAPVVVFFLVYL